MEKAFRLAILAVLALIFVSSPFANASESPFIVAHKRVALKKINSGIERISVSIDVYNRGSATAYDVTLADDSWAQDVFDSVIGNTSKSWERLDAGSLVSHSFELESNVKTIYYGAPALVTYRVLTKSRLQEAYSTPILPLKILSDAESGKMTEKVTFFFIISLVAA
ncbi:translocon-associated subunit beta-like [Olea europaea subsp. europaea]|uniref:Translocon-associated subunit beta-like n=1 Tax=Olea europaea subsp. europaea TaxID=158383 RepID=A0A8S0UN90_OLEEU|nr:translocon-associated subunit beta-like [Olea europaea subsp. europaea]